MALLSAELADIRFTSGASVAPDGSAVAHIVDDGGYPRAVQRFLDGQHALRARWVTFPVEGPVSKVAYSPDSRWLACQLAPGAGTRTQVWLVTNDPDDPSAWSLSGADDSTVELVGWDGDRVAVAATDETGSTQARLVDPHTLSVHVLDERRQTRMVDCWRGDALLRVGPRGYRDMLLRRADGTLIPLLPADHGAVTELGVIVDPARAGQAERAVPDSSRSPDEPTPLRIVVRSDVGCELARLIEVCVDADGRVTRRVLLERPDAAVDDFVVSHDGSTLAVLWNHDGLSSLQVLDLATEVLEEPVRLPGLVASQLSSCASGEVLAVTVEGPGMPPSVELVGSHSHRWRPVEPALTQVDWSYAPTRHEFDAHDGLRLSGWLHRPPGSREPGPTVLYFHGGPEAEERPGYSYLFPALVDAGITVFAPNVRGSGGAGRTFQHADELHRRHAGIADVASCVDYLIQSRVARPGSIGVTGRSYGGYLTYQALTTLPDRFAAAVAICGMSDLAGFYANTEPWIAEAAYPKYGHPVEDAQLLRELSPIHQIERVRSPLLVVHGAHDTNVPVLESQRAVEAVRRMGGYAQFLLFEDEGHEIVTQENQARLATTMVAWFERWLAGPTPARGVRWRG